MLRLLLSILLLASVTACHSTHSPVATKASTRPTTLTDAQLWDLLQSGGQVVLMRHAKTPPGSGEPPNFKLGDCTTQRNLSKEGRAQAEAIGQMFTQRGVRFGEVRSSQYCRCLDTAGLVAHHGDEEPALNNIPDDAPDRDARLDRVRTLAATKPRSGNTLLVTHQPIITALTKLTPAMGDMVIVTPDDNGGFKVAGMLHVAD